tara:strand:- start:720 stop:1328 length:609 start_codon:yes stop_codon:yes gene_type:complete
MITQLFSTPLYNSSFIRDFNKEEIKVYKSINKEYRRNILNLIGKSNRVLDEQSSFSEIREFIQVHLNQFTFQVYGMKRKQNINITTSWLNLTKPGMAHHHHTHPNSFISGVFYFETIPNDSIVFTSSEKNGSYLRFTPAPQTFFNDSCTVNVHNGTLLLFPSWLRHEVPVNKSKKNRISLSFNTYPSGNLLVNEDISNLEIK